MKEQEDVREETGFASSPIMNMSMKTQAGIVAGFLGVPALLLADMALGLADWMVVPEVAGIALVAGVANYALKKNTIDLKAQWKDLDWGSLVGAPRREDEESADDDLPDFKFAPVIEPVDLVVQARQRIVPPGRAPQLPTSRLLDLGDTLQIDIDDWVCKSKFVCGVRGSGKTTLGCRIIEEEAKHSIPMFIVDRKRDYISLADVLPRSMVLGRSDVTRETAKNIATAIFEENYQVILDLASFIQDFDKGCEIATAIVQGLMEWALSHPRDKRCCEVVLDECQAFFPQSGSSLMTDSKIHQRMLSTYGAAIAQGRSLGIGTIILTQRIAETDKKIIGQSELLFLLKQTMPNDLSVYKTLTDVAPEVIKRFDKGQGVFVDYEGVSHIVQFHNRTSDGSMSASPRASSVLRPLSRPVTRHNFASASSLAEEEEEEEKDDMDIYRRAFADPPKDTKRVSAEDERKMKRALHLWQEGHSSVRKLEEASGWSNGETRRIIRLMKGQGMV
jgi:hypothetical protein